MLRRLILRTTANLLKIAKNLSAYMIFQPNQVLIKLYFCLYPPFISFPDMDIVRYWARLRWGLMPEDYTGDQKTFPSYIDSSKECQATRCSLEIEGHFSDPITMQPCRVTPTCTYDEDCVFQTDGCSGKQCSSLMFGSHCVESVRMFIFTSFYQSLQSFINH